MFVHSIIFFKFIFIHFILFFIDEHCHKIKTKISSTTVLVEGIHLELTVISLFRTFKDINYI